MRALFVPGLGLVCSLLLFADARAWARSSYVEREDDAGISVGAPNDGALVHGSVCHSDLTCAFFPLTPIATPTGGSKSSCRCSTERLATCDGNTRMR